MKNAALTLIVMASLALLVGSAIGFGTAQLLKLAAGLI